MRGYVHQVVIGCGAEIIARHPRSYEKGDMVFDPMRFLPLLEQKVGALDQAAPLKGWDLGVEFATLDQLRHLKLHGMARAFAELNDNPQAGELDHGQWLALLLDREEAERDDRRLTYRLRNARLRHPEACIEDVDYRTSRRLDEALFQQLARGKWIAGKQNLIVTGPCGVGKSWLACALGQKACRDDFSVLYKRVPRMFAELETGRADGRYPRLFRALTKANLLILDDWGRRACDKLDQRTGPAPRPPRLRATC